MLRIISLLCILSLATAIDPWERSFTKKDELKDEDPTVNKHQDVCIATKCEQLPRSECKGGVGDNFYKKLLGVIVSRGQFKEREDGIVEGSLHFEFPLFKYELLKEILYKTEPFTPEDYRTVDGLISDHLHKLSFVRQLAESWTAIILRWWERYLIHVIIFLGTCGCIFAIYKANWALVPVKYLIMTIIFFLFYSWELMLAKQEADLKDYQDFVKQSKQCSWIYIFSDCSSTEIVKRVSHYWYLLHPVKILGNLFTRMIMNNIQLVYLQMNESLGHISEKAPWGTQGLVHGVLSLFTLILIMFTAFAFVFNIILNRPFSLNFLGLNLNLKQKVRSNYSHDSNNSNNTSINGSKQPIGDSLSGSNLKILMNALKNNWSTRNIETNNLELPTNRNGEQLRIRFNPKKPKSHNSAGKSTKSNPVHSGKSSPKASGVLNSHKMHGGGDYIG